MAWAVKLFTNPRGDSPVKIFLDKLDHSTHAKSIKMIELLQIHGPGLPPPYSKKLISGVYELRTSGQVASRILYTSHLGTFYLLHAFKKKTNKTPTNELQVAIDRKSKLI